MHFFSVAALVASCTIVNASPTPRPLLQARDNNCSVHANQFPTQDCYRQLNVTNWLQDWWAKNSQSCGVDQNFARCFLAAYKQTGASCWFRSELGCPPPLASYVEDSPEAYYVLWNIYAINSYFSNVWTAAGTAGSSVGGNIGSFVQAFNPIKQQNVALNAVLTAISSILLFVPIPGVSIGGSAAAHAGAAAAGNAGKDAANAGASSGNSAINIVASSGSSAAAEAASVSSGKAVTASSNRNAAIDGVGGTPFYQFYGAISATPVVAKFLFPVGGTLVSQVAQGAAASSNISDIVSNVQQAADNAIKTINSNFTSFLTFANTTFFTAAPIDLQDMSVTYKQLLNAAAIADIMTVNNIAVTVGNLNDWPDYGFSAPGPDGYIDDNWLDTATNDSYSMTNIKDITKSYTKPCKDIFAKNLTTPALLFKTAGSCPQGSSATVSPPNPSNTSSGLQIKCVVNAPLCHYEPKTMASNKEFTDCPTQSGFAVPDCPGNADGNSPALRMPVGYIGAYLKSSYDFC